MNAVQLQNPGNVYTGELCIEATLASHPLHDFHGYTINYRLYGSLDQPINVVMGGISATAYVLDTVNSNDEIVKGWWNRSVGPGKTVDLNKYAVLGIEYLPNNDLAEKFFAQNKSITTHTQAEIVKYLLDALKIKKLHALIGSSYGGMVAMAFAELFPNAVNKLVVLCASDRANSRTTAFRSVQRSIIELASDEKKTEAVGLARSLGMIVYRSHTEFEQRFRNNPFLSENKWNFPVTDYIYNRGQSLALHFTPERFTLLSESCDLHKVKPEKITTDTLLLGFDTDDIVKANEIIQMSRKWSGNVRYKILDTIYGHDAFIVEQHRFANDISNHLNS